MKERIIHITIFGLLLLGMSGCSKSDGEIAPDPSLKPALLELDISLSTRADRENIPECEQIKELRVVVIDVNTGKVEYNKSVDLDEAGLSVQDGKPFRYSCHVGIETTAGTKYLYAFANAENLIGDLVSETSGTRFVERLEQLELTGEIGELNEDGSIPAASRRYEVTLGEKDASGGQAVVTGHVDVVMAYAVTKFDFTFVNRLNTGEGVDVVGWQIDKIAKKSYLIPHMEDADWDKLIGLGGTVDNAEWVTGYTLPPGTPHEGYVRNYQPSQRLAFNGEMDDPTTYYLHESKYFGDFGSTKEQEYVFTLKIKPMGWREDDPPMSLSSGKFPNLESLARGTHVVVVATLRNMPEPGDNSLEVRVKTWINDEPVSGSWEEVTQ